MKIYQSEYLILCKREVSYRFDEGKTIKLNVLKMSINFRSSYTKDVYTTVVDKQLSVENAVC